MAVDAFKCCLRLDPDKAVDWVDKGSELPTLFEAVVKILLLILLIRGFQALLRGLGMVVGDITIHYIHAVNTVCLLHI